MNLISEFIDWHKQMTGWRQDFHQYPELAYKEHRTAAKVAALLQEWGIETHEGIGKTGVVGVIRGQLPGRSIGLRADMDALAMEEKTGLAYRSKSPGCFHGCGHDGHTTILLGAARYLAANPPPAGQVVLIFQPAEEGFAGARAMLEDRLLERFPIDEIYGLHNAPILATGSVAVRKGPLMAACDRFSVTIEGRGGHASAPHKNIDPVVIACQIVGSWQTILSRQVPPLETAVLSTTQINSGTAFNVTPDSAELKGSIRTFDSAIQQDIHHSMTALATSIANGYGATANIKIDTVYPPTVNHPEQTDFLVKVASEILGPTNVDPDIHPRTGSEDFAFFLQKIPGCYFFLGQGSETTSTGVHNSRYLFNDNILPIGSTVFVRLVQKALE